MAITRVDVGLLKVEDEQLMVIARGYQAMVSYQHG